MYEDLFHPDREQFNGGACVITVRMLSGRPSHEPYDRVAAHLVLPSFSQV